MEFLNCVFCFQNFRWYIRESPFRRWNPRLHHTPFLSPIFILNFPEVFIFFLPISLAWVYLSCDRVSFRVDQSNTLFCSTKIFKISSYFTVISSVRTFCSFSIPWTIQLIVVNRISICHFVTLSVSLVVLFCRIFV